MLVYFIARSLYPQEKSVRWQLDKLWHFQSLFRQAHIQQRHHIRKELALLYAIILCVYVWAGMWLFVGYQYLLSSDSMYRMLCPLHASMVFNSSIKYPQFIIPNQYSRLNFVTSVRDTSYADRPINRDIQHSGWGMCSKNVLELFPHNFMMLHYIISS
jgi:hypothetical protein